MSDIIYPWGGKFTEGCRSKPAAVVLLSELVGLREEDVAVWGPLKTENLGIEKVVANTVSNPNIRFIIVAGREVRGHRSGDAIVSLHAKGLDESNRIKGCASAIPYIENLPAEALERFRQQVEVINLIDVEDAGKVNKAIAECLKNNPGRFGEPLIVPHVREEKVGDIGSTSVALHSRLVKRMQGGTSQPKRLRSLGACGSSGGGSVVSHVVSSGSQPIWLGST